MTESTELEAAALAEEAAADQHVPKKSKFDRSIVEGPLSAAVWKIAWPTMLTNGIAGMQGIIDHVLVGNLVGYKANAAIGISFQIFLVVIVFIASIFTGMAVMVARFAGAHEVEKFKVSPKFTLSGSVINASPCSVSRDNLDENTATIRMRR